MIIVVKWSTISFVVIVSFKASSSNGHLPIKAGEIFSHFDTQKCCELRRPGQMGTFVNSKSLKEMLSSFDLLTLNCKCQLQQFHFICGVMNFVTHLIEMLHQNTFQMEGYLFKIFDANIISIGWQPFSRYRFFPKCN